MAKKELTPEQLEARRASNRKSYAKHKEKRRVYKAKYNAENKHKISARSHKYYEEHKDDLNIKSNNYYATHKNEAHNQNVNYRKTHKTEIEKHQLDIKIEVLTHYGNGKCACVKCGFDNTKALSIDHINGHGNTHRRNSNLSGGLEMYRWLKKNNFPEGYQTLCMNCQMIKKIDNKEI